MGLIKGAWHLWFLAVVSIVFWYSPLNEWYSYTLLILGCLVIVHAIGRFATFFFIQRQWHFLYFGVSYLLQGAALILSSLLLIPHYPLEFSWLREPIRILWKIALPFFAHAIYLEAVWGMPLTVTRIKKILRAWKRGRS